MNARPSYSDYLIRILTASVYDVAVETPLEPARGLSGRLNNNILLKREDLQPVFSFKIRGAYNKMAKLSKEALACGVIAASAGNHAQGVALSAHRLGCRAVIVMPETTPQIKIDAVKNRGGEVVLKGVSYNDAYDYAMELAKKDGLTYIAPFDDPDVIAGQGTAGMEIVRQRADKIDAVFVPIGGGGLAAGVAAFIKQVRPDIKVIGVQTDDSCCMKQSIEEGKIVPLKDVGLFSDGTAVKVVGEETFRLCKELLDGVITVDTDAICGAIKDIFDDTRSIMEPAGALALAGLKAYIARNGVQNQTLIAVTSGANMNFHRLRHVSERSELGEGNEGIFGVTIPEEPGSFRKFIDLLGNRNITEFNYRYGNERNAHVFVGLQTAGSRDLATIHAQLNHAGLPNVDLTNDEISKIHIRYMVGGRTDKVKNERLVSFEFPERPGALARFLNHMQSDWNITLFHYRNHGADYGRILVGIDVPPADEAAFNEFLDSLGYVYQDETGNQAYQLFLA
ncbi:threonine ammonia-lyase, biosynthetic [Neisseria weixii]|uniref:L-threonine dehydratase n=1 Tax=Neisseria weixii TaxID=1853276 RepID=A0A3N4N8J3_9NEIS|nr:threonine ammonia-lyase, biosynthetic [Neisseria weixii]ATD65091.1 threonine ammonia-lyase, biosynthetic [Neisseria weixii]RPD83553.1 threonine ammonia-lyase, biosynthetic [Neisseria weixii]RPD83941.1 threonine ammonia-lyase, biosynthetic [Neisseria weixii]